MPFGNPIVGGENLVIPAIKSPNYSAGISGWRIARDGTVEFNGGIFRGSVEIGDPAGQHAILANTATGDPIDVYNSSNKLVFSIDATGRLVSYSSIGTAEVVINGATVFFEDSAQSPILPPLVQGFLNTADQTTLHLSGGIPANGGSVGSGADLQLITGDTDLLSWIQVEQRGSTGAVVQTSGGTGNVGQLLHAGFYTATVSGTGGMATFNHNCGFTPTSGLVAPLTHFSQWNWNDSFGTHGFNSTQAQITMFQPTGTVVGNGVAATLLGVFLG